MDSLQGFWLSHNTSIQVAHLQPDFSRVLRPVKWELYKANELDLFFLERGVDWSLYDIKSGTWLHGQPFELPTLYPKRGLLYIQHYNWGNVYHLLQGRMKRNAVAQAAQISLF